MTVLSSEIESTYEILDTMGGGMGAVYKVRHRLFNEIRIIKVMQAALKDDSSLRERFSAEAKRGKQLKHKNIAEVLDFLIGSDGNAYLVMEYVDGINLREAFSRTGRPLDPRTVIVIGEQTLAGLGYLHARNLIHRDISPENLMVTRDDDGCLLVKLIDLGIAKSLEDTVTLTRAGDFMGKLSYASPEQFGEKVDSRSDLYSLGIVLYELLTRFKPITAANTGAFILAHYQTPPRPFSQTDPHSLIPEALRQVVLKALEKKPANRYQTAGEFASALDATLSISNMPPATPDTASLPPLPASSPPPAPTLTTTLSSTQRTAIPSSLPPPEPWIAAPTLIATPSSTGSRGIGIGGLIAVATLALIVVVALTFAGLEYLRNRPNASVTPPQPAAQTTAGSGTTIEVPATQSARRPSTQETEPETVDVSSIVKTPVATDTGLQIAEKATSTGVATATDQALSGSRQINRVDTVSPLNATTGTNVQPAATTSSPSRPDLAEGDRQRKQALAFSNAHQWQNAVNAWRDFIREYSGVNPAADHAAYYNLGVAYESLQNWREAADAFERAIVTNNGSSDTSNLLHLARCYGKLGRWNDAVATYERVLKADPQNETAKRSLPLALHQTPRGQ